MYKVKHKKFTLPDKAADFKNMMSTVVREGDVAFLFSDDVLNECAARVDTLNTVAAHRYVRVLFSMAVCASINKRGKVKLLDNSPLLSMLDDGFDICKLKTGLYALIPVGKRLESSVIFKEEVEKYLDTTTKNENY